MNVVVAGGSGFLGKAIVGALRTAGHSVIILSRSQPDAGAVPQEGVTVVQWDGATAGPWAARIDGADAVVNFTGESLDARRWSPRQKALIIASRVNPAVAIREAVARASRKPAVVLNASAVGYYGPHGDEELDERAPLGAGFLAETCARWEDAARAIGKEGPRVVILRCGVVLGPRGGALHKMALQYKLFAGGTLGTGRQWFPWVHRDDLARIVLFALERPDLRGPVNVVAPEAVTMRAVGSALGRVLHRPSLIPVPGFILRTVLGEMADMVLTGQRVVPAQLRAAGYTFRFPALLPALTDILA